MRSEYTAMSIELRQRVAVITGGANGIGRSTALAFAEAGAAVAIWDMVDQAGLALADEINAGGGQAVFQHVNVTSTSEVEAAVATTLDRFGRIDILVNNAGITRDSQLIKIKDGEVVGKMSEAEFDAVLNVNLKGVFICTQSIAPVMVRQGYGRIINAASVVALYGNFGQTNYVATKSAVIGMTKVWARELGKRGITVNAVAPGFIATDMTRGMPDRVLAAMVERTPVGRMGEPRDIANAYLFLGSEAASFINGTVLSVDGGLVLGT
ncbi:MAG TPA: 3-oxoacyl-ACP reductase FabG [Kouleothrix sp.]|nr:3-oxoacyl-ACP reductase FabG [Kouleothrix sp.]HRC74838.1 3-oxoacyl-ACP reductase FabG [Kouleothrix sp.]